LVEVNARYETGNNGIHVCTMQAIFTAAME